MYELRFCEKNEIDKLMTFIGENIRPNEILANDIKFVDWLFYNKHNDKYNFLLAVDCKTNDIHGLYSIIPTFQFDDELTEFNDIWGGNNVVKESERGKGIGRLLLTYIDQNYKKSYSGMGISDMAFPLYEKFGYKTGYLNHYYILNEKISSFTIAGCLKSTKKQNNKLINTSFKMEEIVSLEDVNIEPLCNIRPKKTIRFVINRYFNHPVYKYRYFIIKRDNKNLALIVIKKINIGSSSCLRIVDIIGDFSCISNIRFKYLLESENSEYIDCLNYGLEEEIFFKSGFLKKAEEIIIPEHFEPFERINIPINFALKCKYKYVIFKGDGSLDRPNKTI